MNDLTAYPCGYEYLIKRDFFTSRACFFSRTRGAAHPNSVTGNLKFIFFEQDAA